MKGIVFRYFLTAAALAGVCTHSLQLSMKLSANSFMEKQIPNPFDHVNLQEPKEDVAADTEVDAAPADAVPSVEAEDSVGPEEEAAEAVEPAKAVAPTEPAAAPTEPAAAPAEPAAAPAEPAAAPAEAAAAPAEPAAVPSEKPPSTPAEVPAPAETEPSDAAEPAKTPQNEWPQTETPGSGIPLKDGSTELPDHGDNLQFPTDADQAPDAKGKTEIQDPKDPPHDPEEKRIAAQRILLDGIAAPRSFEEAENICENLWHACESSEQKFKADRSVSRETALKCPKISKLIDQGILREEDFGAQLDASDYKFKCVATIFRPPPAPRPAAPLQGCRAAFEACIAVQGGSELPPAHENLFLSKQTIVNSCPITEFIIAEGHLDPKDVPAEGVEESDFLDGCVKVSEAMIKAKHVVEGGHKKGGPPGMEDAKELFEGKKKLVMPYLPSPEESCASFWDECQHGNEVFLYNNIGAVDLFASLRRRVEAAVTGFYVKPTSGVNFLAKETSLIQRFEKKLLKDTGKFGKFSHDAPITASEDAPTTLATSEDPSVPLTFVESSGACKKVARTMLDSDIEKFGIRKEAQQLKNVTTSLLEVSPSLTRSTYFHLCQNLIWQTPGAKAPTNPADLEHHLLPKRTEIDMDTCTTCQDNCHYLTQTCHQKSDKSNDCKLCEECHYQHKPWPVFGTEDIPGHIACETDKDSGCQVCHVLHESCSRDHFDECMGGCERSSCPAQLAASGVRSGLAANLDQCTACYRACNDDDCKMKCDNICSREDKEERRGKRQSRKVKKAAKNKRLFKDQLKSTAGTVAADLAKTQRKERK